MPESWDDTRAETNEEAAAIVARWALAGIPDTVRHRTKWSQALEIIDEVITRGHRPPVVVADAGYGETTAFRLGLTVNIPLSEDGTLPGAGLLTEWPPNEREPTDYWISDLPADASLKTLVRLATIQCGAWNTTTANSRPDSGSPTSKDAPSPAGTVTSPSSPPPTSSSPDCGSRTQKAAGAD